MSYINEAGNSIYDLTIKSSDILYDIQTLERELKETEIYKKIKELEKKQNELKKIVDDRKAIVKQAMQNAGLKSMEFEHQKVTLKKSPGKVVIKDEAVIPDNYKKEKVTITIDKKVIKEGLSLGDIIPGTVIEYSYSLLITPKK